MHEIGLSTAEAEIYLELLKEDDVRASELSDRVSTSRTHIYDTLDGLVDKALVTYNIKGGKRYYQAAHPRKLVDYLSERKNRLEDQKAQMVELIPEFIKLHGDNSKKPRIEIFEGREGFKTILKDILRTGLNFLVLNASEGLNNEFGIPLQQFYRDRKHQKLGARMLYPVGAEPIKNTLDKVKFIAAEKTRPIPMYIYGDNVAIVLALEEIMVVRVTNMAFAQSLAKEFDILWNQDVRTMRGLDAIQALFEEMLEAGHCDFLGARGYFVEQRPEFIRDWKKRAGKLGFTMRNIVDPEVRGHDITQFKFAKTKYTLSQAFMGLSVFWIYGKKVAIANWAGSEPIVFVIENKQLYETYKQQFELLWESRG